MPSLDLSDADLTALAMACRSAAHHANGRRLQERKGKGLVVSPEAFIALAERLEGVRAAVTQQSLHKIVRLDAEARTRLGWSEDMAKPDPK